MRHLMSPLDFSVEELDHLLDLAQDIEANPEKYAHLVLRAEHAYPPKPRGGHAEPRRQHHGIFLCRLQFRRQRGKRR